MGVSSKIGDPHGYNNPKLVSDGLEVYAVLGARARARHEKRERSRSEGLIQVFVARASGIGALGRFGLPGFRA